MSKIAEQKALEAYPQKYDDLLESNVHRRIGYKQGYDQAMQDLLQKAEKFFNEELFTRFNGEEYRISSNKCMSMNLRQFAEHFKNYIQNESN